MVVPDDLVVLEVPALDHLILTAREEVGRAAAHCQPAHCRDMARERELERARGEVPDLDGAIGRTRREPLVGRVHRDRAHPSQMARDYPHHLPRCVPLWLHHWARGAAARDERRRVGRRGGRDDGGRRRTGQPFGRCARPNGPTEATIAAVLKHEWPIGSSSAAAAERGGSHGRMRHHDRGRGAARRNGRQVLDKLVLRVLLDRRAQKGGGLIGFYPLAVVR